MERRSGFMETTRVPTSALGGEMIYLDLQDAPLDEAQAALALQGIVNRGGPRIFVFPGKKNVWGQFVGQESAEKKCLPDDFLTRYRNTDDLYEEYYVRHRGFNKRVVPSFDSLLAEWGHLLRGLVVYEPEALDQRVIAFSFASAEDFLPVTRELLSRHPSLASLPVRHDLAGRFADRVESQRWAWRLLSAKCNRRGVTSYWPKETSFSIDHGISRRNFFFNLCFLSCEKPAEYELLHEILSGIDSGGVLYGWGDNGENSLINSIAPHGLFLQCDPAPNLSFHRAVKPVASRHAMRRTLDPARVRLEKKHYVAFLLNEGDTLKCMGTMFNGGQWVWPQRGRVPINWGISPWIVEEFPAMMEAYYSTMTERDLFFSSVTGYGYYSPKHSIATGHFAEAERRANPAAGMSTGSVYSVHDMIDACNGILDPATDAWLVARGCDGFVFEAAQQASLKFTSALQPLIGADWALFYWRFRFPPGIEPLPAAIDRIRALAREHEAPSLIPVYAGSPEEFKAMADALPADEFEVVLLDEFVELAKQIGRAQLDRETLDLRGESSRNVTLTLRHWDPVPRSGCINVGSPSGWSVSPATLDYADLRPGEAREYLFSVTGPSTITSDPERIAFSDSGSGRELGLRVRQGGAPAMRIKPPSARKIIAARGTPKLDGRGRGWGDIRSTVLDHDLAALGKGCAAARYRWAWDDEALFLLVEETRAPAVIAECPHGLYFAGGEFKRANGVSFWFDFSGSGTTENGDFAPRFGFSSSSRRDLYTCTLNHRVLVSSRPAAEVFTSGAPGSRIIEARIPWAEIDALLVEELIPAGGLCSAVRTGFGFGCQPLLIESQEHQAYRNGAHPTVETGAAVTLEAVKIHSGPPSGNDVDSLWIELG